MPAPKVFSVPEQTYPAGVPTLVSAAGQTTFAKPNGQRQLASLQMAGPTDWQTGPAGRTLDVVLRKAPDGANFAPSAETQLTSPQLAKDGVSLPTVLEAYLGGDPDGTLYQVQCTAGGGDVSSAWTLTLS